MRLSKTTSYAIRILLDCANADSQLVKVAEISERRDITLQNTFKIVHLLSRAGFVQAVRGRHGGVRLARPATEIRIGDVVRAMETMRVELENENEESPGSLDELFDTALAAFISVLDEHTLADMAKGNRLAKRPPARDGDQAPQPKPAVAAKAKAAKTKPTKALRTSSAQAFRRHDLER